MSNQEPKHVTHDGPIDVWMIDGVDGAVSFLLNGEIAILHAGDGRIVHLDQLFSARAPGKPVEMTRLQAIGLAKLMLRALGEPEH